MKKLRILFTVLAAVCLVAIIPAGIFFDWIGFLVCGVPALIFFLLMLLCKQAQEKQESTPSVPEKKNDSNDDSEK